MLELRAVAAAATLTQAACSPTRHWAFIPAGEAVLPSENSHHCRIWMRRAAFSTRLRPSDSNYSITRKPNAHVSLWSLHWFLDPQLHRECHKFTCYLWKIDTALEALMYLKRGVREKNPKTTYPCSHKALSVWHVWESENWKLFKKEDEQFLLIPFP